MEQLGSNWTDRFFHEIKYLWIFGKSFEKIYTSYKYDKNYGNFMGRRMSIYSIWLDFS